jgi:hypothetical protein
VKLPDHGCVELRFGGGPMPNARCTLWPHWRNPNEIKKGFEFCDREEEAGRHQEGVG